MLISETHNIRVRLWVNPIGEAWIVSHDERDVAMVTGLFAKARARRKAQRYLRDLTLATN